MEVRHGAIWGCVSASVDAFRVPVSKKCLLTVVGWDNTFRWAHVTTLTEPSPVIPTGGEYEC